MMKIPRRVRRIAVTVIAFAGGLWAADLMLSARTAAEVTTAPATQPTIELPAQAVVDRLFAAYAKQPVTIEGTLSIDFDVGGMVEQRKSRIVSSALSSTKFAHEIEGEIRIVGDGESMHVFDLKQNVYLSKKLADTSSKDGPIDLVGSMLREQNPAILMSILPAKTDGLFVGGEHVALETDAGEPTLDVLVSTDGAVTRKYFVEKSTGTLNRIETDFRTLLTTQGAREVKRASATITYTRTDFASQPDPIQFAFKPPADATEARDTSRELLVAAGDAKRLIGQRAPAFELNDLNGKSVSLESLKGKVVVMDFWATWCAPCIEALPHLDKLAKDYQGKDVVVLAVNEEEDLDTVRTFITEKKLSVTTLLDMEASVSKRYLVAGLPTQVVIGRDGSVRQVFVGIAGDYVEKLTVEIEAALK